MISGRDFLVLSDDWNGLPTSTIHLFRRLARRNRVFWFNTVGRLPRPTRADAAKVLRAVGNWLRPRRAAAESGPASGVEVISPVMVPWFKPLVRRFNRASFLRAYGKLCARHAIRDPIVVTTFPFTVDFVRAVPAAMKIYACVDDFLDYPGVHHADWAAMEAELLDHVDGLVVTSRELARKRRTACPLLHLPHGVDFEHYQGARGGPVPRLDGLPRPVVGFFGLLSEWFDLGLVGHLSETFPDVSFVLIGRAHVDPTPLTRRPNVHYLGWVPYDELPHYGRAFDVGLIPYVQSRFTRSINPLKLMEYFALGLPVLATRLPELEGVEGPVRLASTREEFRAGLRALLDGGPGRYADDAVAVARQNTWDRRAEQFSEFLGALSGGRGAGRAVPAGAAG